MLTTFTSKPCRILHLRSRVLPLLGVMIALFATAVPVHAAEVFPATLELADSGLVKQGVGTRKKAFLSLYKAGLYLLSSNSDAAAISSADEPMAIRLQIVSGFISSEKMNTAMRDGFNKATGGKVAPIQAGIDSFATGFSEEIDKKDVFDLVYLPATGVQVIKNGETKVTVPDLAFKQALFGIWLSENPIQASLKKAMLGTK